MVKSQTIHKMLLLSYLPVLIWSLIKPTKYGIWLAEVGPAVLLILILIVVYKRFRLTTITYTLIWLASIMMAVGGHYTYEHVPLFDWIRDQFDLQRNNFDRLGHCIKGLLIGLLTRELLLRTSPLEKGGWLFSLTLAVAMAIANAYELVEFAATKIVSGEGQEEFLGMQGDKWDAQWDMLLTTVGCLLAYLLFRRLQDKQLNRIVAEDRD